MKELLKGMIDMHVHGGPACIKRLHSMEIAREMAEAGYAGFVIKDHHLPTPALAQVVTEEIRKEQEEGKLPGSGFTAYGSICLNAAVGGMNVNAVDAAVQMGAKVVYLPTISSPRHMEIQSGMFAGAASVPERPVDICDENGNLTKETEEVLSYLAAHKDIVLATGHVAAWKLDKAMKRAIELGVERIFMNHPAHTIGASWEQIDEWVKLPGVYLEMQAVDIIGLSNMGRFPFSMVEDFFRHVPAEKAILSSDFGQPVNGSARSVVEGMVRYLEAVHERIGVSEKDIVTMIRDNPEKLMA